MPDISKITLPSGNTYDIKDAGARELIAALAGSTAYVGVTTTALTDGDTTNPITVNGSSYTAKTGNIVVYGSAEFIFDGTKWNEFGDLSRLGALAYKDTVSLSKGSGDQVLGEATTFTAAASAVSFSGGATDTFVKSVSAETNKKLVTTTVPNVTGNTNVTIPNVTGNTNVSIPNVTSVGAASTWGFAMGTGDNSETLIISGANGSAPTLGTALSASKVTLGTALSASKVTLGTAKTVATGATDANGTGDAIVTGVTIGESASAVTSIGTATAAAQTITVGTNDKVKVAKYDDLSVSAS